MGNYFDVCFSKIIKTEGGYVDDSADRGGKTKYGITEAVARENNYSGAMIDLPIEKAKQIYKKDYWDKLSCDEIHNTCIAYTLFDTSVNMGVKQAALYLQKALRIISGDDIIVDGIIGKATILKLNESSERDSLYILEILNCYRLNLYLQLCIKDSRQKKFLRGWIKRIIKSREVYLI